MQVSRLATLVIGFTLAISPRFVWAGQFTQGPSYPVDSGPRSAILADFNRDGKLDMAVATLNSTVDVLLGNGDGTFQPAVSYPLAGMRPWQVIAGDFANNGILDLVAATGYGQTVSILMGNGDGTFQPAKSIKTGWHPMAVEVADLNRDGNLDLLVANHTYGTLEVFLGNGDGTFQTPKNYALGPVTNYPFLLLPRWIAVTDFNNDGIPDVAVVNAGDKGQGNSVSVLLGKGDGSFWPAVYWNTGVQPIGIAVGDFNRDGNMDMVTVDNTSNTASVFLGNGDGTFQPRVPYAVGNKPQNAVVADFNGDGYLDIVVSNQDSVNVTLLLGRGDGTFQSGGNYPAGAFPENLATGDVNGDGTPDLAVPDYNSNSVQVLFNSGAPRISH